MCKVKPERPASAERTSVRSWELICAREREERTEASGNSERKDGANLGAQLGIELPHPLQLLLVLHRLRLELLRARRELLQALHLGKHGERVRKTLLALDRACTPF